MEPDPDATRLTAKQNIAYTAIFIACVAITVALGLLAANESGIHPLLFLRR